MSQLQSQAGWKWYGFAGHLIVSARCAYHLTTAINGKYPVSTVGEFRPDPRNRLEEVEQVGLDRMFETMVFEIDGEDEFTNPKRAGEGIETVGYNDSIEAERGHYAMCEKYAAEAV